MNSPVCITLDMATADACGHKAAHLARVAGAGLRIPDTIVVTRAALRGFLNHNEMEGDVAAWLASWSERSATQVAAAHEELRQRAAAADWPVALRREIVSAPIRTTPRSH